MGIHGCGCTNRNCNERCVLGNEAPKVKNRQAEKGLIASRRHYTRIHIEMARELNDANKRKGIQDYQNENKKFREDAIKEIKKLYYNNIKEVFMRLVSIVFLITVILIGLGIYFLIKFFTLNFP